MKEVCTIFKWYNTCCYFMYTARKCDYLHRYGRRDERQQGYGAERS